MEMAADNATAANTLYNVNGHFGRRRHPIVTPECGGSTQRYTHIQQTRQALRIRCPPSFAPTLNPRRVSRTIENFLRNLGCYVI